MCSCTELQRQVLALLGAPEDAFSVATVGRNSRQIGSRPAESRSGHISSPKIESSPPNRLQSRGLSSIPLSEGHAKSENFRSGPRLRDNRLSVWSDPTYAVSNAADALVGSSKVVDCLNLQLPYGEASRTLQIDVVVHDTLHRMLEHGPQARASGSALAHACA